MYWQGRPSWTMTTKRDAKVQRNASSNCFEKWANGTQQIDESLERISSTSKSCRCGKAMTAASFWAFSFYLQFVCYRNAIETLSKLNVRTILSLMLLLVESTTWLLYSRDDLIFGKQHQFSSKEDFVTLFLEEPTMVSTTVSL